MKNILVVGPYADGTGWGRACQEFILALDTTNLDVYCNFVKLNNINAFVPRRIVDIQNKEYRESYDYLFQVCIPELLNYGDCDGKFNKNVAVIFDEVVRNSGERLSYDLLTKNYIDNVILYAPYAGVQEFPVPTDISKYRKLYTSSKVVGSDNLCFYFIGEFTSRKNIISLLHSYYCAFDSNDNVSLIIKTWLPGMSDSEIVDKFNEIDDILKRGIGRKQNMYPHVHLYVGYMDENEIYAMHCKYDVFVNMSCGEGWCFPAFDAYAFGNCIIGTKANCTFIKYVSKRDSSSGTFLCNYSLDFVSKFNDSQYELFNSRDYWYRPNMVCFANTMKDVYRSGAGKKTHNRDISVFSYDNVGKLIENYLESL